MFAPEPPTITSSPPAPSIVSFPEPPVIVFAAAEPRIVIAPLTACAFTFVNPVTKVEPLVWFVALARLMFVDASRTSVDTPVPAEIETSPP